MMLCPFAVAFLVFLETINTQQPSYFVVAGIKLGFK